MIENRLPKKDSITGEFLPLQYDIRIECESEEIEAQLYNLA